LSTELRLGRVAVIEAGRLEVRKCLGRLDALEAVLQARPVEGRSVLSHPLGHHGEPSEVNSHPHTDEEGARGGPQRIIENYWNSRRN